MEAMWAESDSRTPMICFLSMGSDPTDNIERLAKSKGIRTYCCLSVDCRRQRADGNIVFVLNIREIVYEIKILV